MRAISIAATSAAVAATLAAACGSSNPEPVAPPPPAPSASVAAAPRTPPGPPKVETTLASVGLDGTAIDRSVDPCTDFYQFACGKWLERTEIPPDKSKWARSFSEIFEKNEAELRDILEAAAKNPGDDPVSKKIGAYYSACMDEPGIEKAGIKPIAKLLAEAKKVRDPKSMTALVTELHKNKIWALFDVSSSQDFKDATKEIASLDQNGLGLPDRDYYTKDDDDSKKIRARYVEHVGKMMQLAGMTKKQADKAAADVLKIETELAKISKTRVERRDPKGMYNKIDRAGVVKAAPAFGWDAYFKGIGFPDLQEISVTSVPYFEGLEKVLGAFKPAEWQSYFEWQIVHRAAPALSKAFVDENFAMDQALTGVKELPKRWKRCVESTDRGLGELLAQPYVKASFPGDSKVAAEQMVHEISAAFGHEVDKLDWMDDATKKRALEKLADMAYLIGYPDKWKEYDFAIDPKAYAANVLASRAWDLHRDLAKIGKPVDRKEWQMTPPTVNAYYDPQMNHMVFPAGILQPPFYSSKYAIAVNLGGMGMVVGHELTHGFDDEGSQFDGKGNLDNWWAPEVGEKFRGKTSCIADEYGSFETVPGVKLNGKLTLGENIADNGGILLAYEAYKTLRDGAKEAYVADGFSEDQQFFLATGQAWCSKQRDEYAKMAAQVDPHSPPKFRVNGSLSNLKPFWDAFSCKEGTPMHPAKACKVW
jgi:putative endopeptidase